MLRQRHKTDKIKHIYYLYLRSHLKSELSVQPTTKKITAIKNKNPIAVQTKTHGTIFDRY